MSSASWKALAAPDNHTCGVVLSSSCSAWPFFSIRTMLNWGVEWEFGTFTNIFVKFQ